MLKVHRLKKQLKRVKHNVFYDWKKGGTTVGIGRGGKNLIKKKKKNRVQLNEGGYIGKAIRSEYGGVKLSNKSYEKYYKGMI